MKKWKNKLRKKNKKYNSSLNQTVNNQDGIKLKNTEEINEKEESIEPPEEVTEELLETKIDTEEVNENSNEDKETFKTELLIPENEKPLVQLTNVSKHYTLGDTVTKAVDDISLKIYNNELVAIVGASGSGKTTLMNIIGCLDNEYMGEYKLNGEVPQGLSKTDVAKVRNKEIGFVFQKYHLIPELTVYENVELPLVYANYPKNKRKEKVEEALERVGLLEKAQNLPNQLSGGQQQRVSIARALINNPHIILADEPTGALDSKTGKEVMELIKSLAKENKTVILVTHDMSIAQQMNRIIEVRDGKVLSDTKKEEQNVS